MRFTTGHPRARRRAATLVARVSVLAAVLLAALPAAASATPVYVSISGDTMVVSGANYQDDDIAVVDAPGSGVRVTAPDGITRSGDAQTRCSVVDAATVDCSLEEADGGAIEAVRTWIVQGGSGANSGADVITVNAPEGQFICGNWAYVQVFGYDGDDHLIGGPGPQDLHGDGLPWDLTSPCGDGTQGDDIIEPGLSLSQAHDTGSNDYITGCGGNDLVVQAPLVEDSGRLDRDWIELGDGIDRVSYAARSADHPVRASLDGNDDDGYWHPSPSSRENDHLDGVEELVGTPGPDRLEGFFTDVGTGFVHDGGAGDDVFVSGPSDERFIGGPGTDRVSYEDAASAVTADPDGVAGDDGMATESDTIDTDVEIVQGSAHADALACAAAGCELRGGAGNDTLVGGAGNDVILPGNDFDTVTFGGGTDVLSYEDLIAAQGVKVTAISQPDALANGLPTGCGATPGYIDKDLEENLTDAPEQLRGSGYADLLCGTAADDVLEGLAGNDQLIGGEGADVLRGGTGADELAGDPSNVGFADVLEGGDGNDILRGGPGSDVLRGEAGNDDLRGQEGNDTLEGGDGDDSLEGQEGNDVLRPGLGSNTLRFDTPGPAEGFDALDYRDRPGSDGVRQSVASTADGQQPGCAGGLPAGVVDPTDTLLDAPDRLLGTDQDDILCGGAGNDRIDGEGGNDVLRGNVGIDELHGGDGDDQLYGGDQTDYMYGEAGADQIHGEEGYDFAWGGDGDDVMTGGNHVDRMTGEAGNDVMSGGDYFDVLDGSEGDDTLSGDAGNDVIVGRDGVDTIDGGAGNDRLLGGNDGDVITGGDGNDRLDGENGDDDLRGGDGNDLLVDGSGDDYMAGDGGNDQFAMGGGADWAQGGPGLDTADYRFRSAPVIVKLNGWSDDGYVGEGDNVRTDVERVFGGKSNDVLVGNFYRNYLYGYNGNDRLIGSNGSDILLGLNGNDVIIGGAHGDLMRGGSGRDAIISRDRLWRDTVMGDAGVDRARIDRIDRVLGVEGFY